MSDFIKGRDNLACTIFVPWDCGNNCPFCTSKEMYKDFVYNDTYLNKIIEWVKKLNTSDFINEFVITGGEPIMDLEKLKKIVTVCKKPVFINTSLPKVKNIYEVIKFINETNVIKGINISRHIGYTHDVVTYGTDVIEMITKPVRINCLVTDKNFSIDKVEKLLKTYITKDNIMLNLRADYRIITDKTLKNMDNIFTQLLDEYKYNGSTSCLVCNSSHFETNDKKVICYHRGTEKSSVKTKQGIYVNDVIIDIYGNPWYDWFDNEDITKVTFYDFLNSTTKHSAELEYLITHEAKRLVTPIKPTSEVTISGGCGYRTKKKKRINTSCGMGQSNCGIGTSTGGGCGLPVRNCGGGYTYGYSGCGIRSGC